MQKIPMNPEKRFGYFSYRPKHPSDTCQEISQELKDVLMEVVNYAFANKDTNKAIRKEIQRAETNRCELALDDILKPTPEWSGRWSKRLKSELLLLCYEVWQYFRQNQTLLDFTKKEKYVMFLNVVKVDPGARSQVRHKDFNFGDERHFYEMLFPLTEHSGQGGTNFGLSGEPQEFPKPKLGYYWNGHIEHQGTANESKQTRYAFNIEMVAIPDEVPLNKYQLNRYAWKCDNFETVYIERREKGRDIGVIKDLELKEVFSDEEGKEALEHPYRLFPYKMDNPSDTCKQITQKMKDNLKVVQRYAFANAQTNRAIEDDLLYIFADDEEDTLDISPDRDRCELKLDDFLRPEPTWCTHFREEERDIIQNQLKNVCKLIFKTLQRAKLLNAKNIDKYVTIFNIIKVPDGSAAQPWHSDFKTEGAEKTHLYQAIFPLTDYDNQGGTNFNETGKPDFPPRRRGYFFDGFTGHQGTANTSGKTRYALNAETFCVVEGVLFNDYQEDRYGLRCWDLETVHTRPKTSSGAAGGGASAVPDKMSAGGASAAPRPKFSGGAYAAPRPKSSGGIQDEIAARQAAEESRRKRYEEKQNRQIGSGGGAAPPMPEVIVISDDDDKGGGLGACIQLLHLRLMAMEKQIQ